MTAIEIRKGNGIGGLVRGHVPRMTDETRDVDAVDSRVIRVQEKFADYLYNQLKYAVPDPVSTIEGLDDVLSPSEINAVLQTIIVHEEYPRSKFDTAFFISRLIQNSYDAGYNNFTLYVASEIYFLCSHLKADKRPLDVIIHGNVARSFGEGSEDVSFKICGSPKIYCGDSTRNCSFTIMGDVGKQCGVKSEGSVFMIAGDADNELGRESRRSRFHVEDLLADYCGIYAERSIFSTPYSDTLAKMIKDVPVFNGLIEIPMFNRVIHDINGDTREIMRPWKYVTTFANRVKEFIMSDPYEIR